MHTYMIIGVVVYILFVFLCVVVDHILELPLLVVKPSQVFIDGLMMDESIHEIVRIFR
jgi:hypothetical protein